MLPSETFRAFNTRYSEESVDDQLLHTLLALSLPPLAFYNECKIFPPVNSKVSAPNSDSLQSLVADVAEPIQELGNYSLKHLINLVGVKLRKNPTSCF